MKTYPAFIFARGGSKGVPKKNIRVVGGKPLIAHAIQCAQAARRIDGIIVSTDCEEIAATARAYGASVPFLRPPELATDKASELLAWRHAINTYPEISGGRSLELLVSVPTTSPLRIPEDIDQAIEKFEAGDFDIMMAITPSHRNPFLNMVTIDQEETIHLVNEPGKEWSVYQRQSTPDVYDITTLIYVARPDYVLATDLLIRGRVGYHMVPPERALDVDDAFDLHMADLLLTHPVPDNPAPTES